MTTPRLVLYYDGLCPLCSREIAHYRRRAAGLPIAFVDITGPGFDAVAQGLAPDRIHRVMHVRLDGTLYTGVEAFVAIWRVIPGFGWLARLVRLPLVYPVARVSYRLFAAVRPHLPRRRSACETGTCDR